MTEHDEELWEEAFTEGWERGRSTMRAEIEQLRRWIYATARSMKASGLSLEEYNAITAEVCHVLEQKP